MSTRVIALFLEAVRDPASFVAALAKARKKRIPVLIVKVGRTEASARLAQTHTDALVGDDAAFDAVLERYGAVRLRTLDELIAAASLLASPKAIPSGNLTVMIDSGGLRESLIDLAEERGVKLTQLGADATNLLRETLPSYLPAVNPLDIGVPLKVDRPPMVKRIWESFLADPGTAIGAFEFEVFDDFCYSPGLIDAAEEIALASPKPFILFSTVTRARNNTVAQRFAEKGIPVINGVDNFLAAVKTAFAYRDFVPQPSIPLKENETSWSTRLQTAVPLDETEGLAMLRDFGIPVVASRVVESSADAIAAARMLGFPIAVKTANPGIAHKSDVKGVRLGLADEAAVRGAYEDIASRLGSRVTIATMASPGVELAFGAVVDPQFGPVVMVGMGGKLVEVLSDRVVALAPFDSSEAGRLIDRLRGRKLLDGVRGDPPCNVTAAAEALATFSRLAAALSNAIEAIDVNPVIVGPSGVVAVDALVVTRHQKHSSSGETK